MSFLVQDFLDFAQIKTGKFRKQITTFNIRDTVEKVMSIQRKKAEDAGIRFFATFNNINVWLEELESMHSPLVTADE